jgi:hypothetical protein
MKVGDNLTVLEVSDNEVVLVDDSGHRYMLDLLAVASAGTIKTEYVQTITVIDPDSGGDVSVEVRKLETGPMVGIDESYLEQEVGPVFSPYDGGVELEIPDDE